MARPTTIETPRKLQEKQGLTSSASPEGTPDSGPYTMPQPRLPFVKFQFSGSDEPAYAIVLRQGDRSLDLGVFAANHRTIQQKDGVRHATDPDMVRLAEYVPGIWCDLEEVDAIYSRLEALEETVNLLAATKP